MVIVRFSPVDWSDIYSVLGYAHAWLTLKHKPKYVHVSVSCDGQRYFSMSVNRGVYYDDADYPGCEYVTYPHCSAEYMFNFFEICLYRKIRFSMHLTCIMFVATAIHLHTLQFNTADDFYEALSALSELLD